MNKYKIGSIVSGKVSGIEKYGIFLTFDDGYTGLIHISEVSDKFVNNIYNIVSINDELKSQIIDVDDKNKHLKLSLKNICEIDTGNTVIKEVGSGYKILKDHLNEWISIKINKKK